MQVQNKWRNIDIESIRAEVETENDMRSGFVRELQKQVYEHEHFAFYEKKFIEACNSNLVPFIIDDKGTGAAVAMWIILGAKYNVDVFHFELEKAIFADPNSNTKIMNNGMMEQRAIILAQD